MQARLNILRGAAIVSALAMSLAACGGGSSSNKSSGGTPVKGGTLKLVGAGDVDHVDTASAYTTVANQLERAWTRQLFSYQSNNDVTKGSVIQADAAAEIPTQANGGISADGKTITIHLRSGVQWSTTPARAVTADDWIRGIKRECNPDPSGAGGNPTYYTGTIEGFAAFCTGFAKVKDSVTDIANYINSKNVSGMQAPDANTLVFKLTAPASDFFNILAMPFASAAPVEYLKYLPDSAPFRQNTLSDGPYKISKYVASKQIDLVRNPAWSASTDPLRKAYVDAIQLTEGQASPDAAEQQLDAGTADLGWDWAVPTTTLHQLQASKSSRLKIFSSANTNPFLDFNFRSPSNNKAMANLHIRQAIEYAINKVSLAKIYGGLDLNTPLSTVIPPGSVGYVASNDYPSPNNEGDVNKCKELLAQGLKEVGLTKLQPLQYVYRNSSNHPKVTQSVAANLTACGIPTKIFPTTPDDFYGKFLANPAAATEGKWDIAAPGWGADWPGNNGRAIIEPLFASSNCSINGVNYGCFKDAETDSLIKQAEQATDTNSAATLWAKADQRIMSQAAFVPFMQQLTPLTNSARVRNALYYVTAQAYDPTNIWLSNS